MAAYPVFLQLDGKYCLVVGSGPQAAARASGLSQAGARVRCFAGGSDLPAVNDLEEALLVFLCEPDAEGADLLATEARARACLVALHDRAEGSDFVMGAVATRGPITVAVSTSGASPALACSLRDAIETNVGDEWGRAAEVMGRLRPLLVARVPRWSERARIYHCIVDGGLVDLLRAGRDDELLALVETALGGPVDRAELGI